jgi:L-2,4-diaminobutyrate decarboxylase
MMGFVLYASLSTYGEAFFAEYVASMGRLARDFAQMIRESPDFELAVMPDANIVCFRYMGKSGNEDSDRMQEEIRSRLIASGRFYLVQTRLRGRLYLRTTLINPTTRLSHLRELLDAIRS